MAELIGTTSPNYYSTSFKQELLLVDKIAYPWLSASLAVELADDANPFRVELDYLRDKGLLFDPIQALWPNEPINMLELLQTPNDFFSGSAGLPYAFGFGSMLTHEQQLLEAILRRPPEGDHGSFRALDAIRALREIQSLGARAFAILLREKAGLEAVPLNSGPEFKEPVLGQKAEVLHLVLRELPMPSEQHSVDDVLAFKDEMRAGGYPQSLRVWINETASGQSAPAEVSDKLEDLVSRYDRALTLEKMSRSTGLLETMVVTTAEIAESLVKFQWSAVAKKLFEVRHRRVALMKAEMTLPGREVAYIVKARERFGA